MSERDRLEFTLKRLDHYFQILENKTHVLIVIATIYYSGTLIISGGESLFLFKGECLVWPIMEGVFYFSILVFLTFIVSPLFRFETKSVYYFRSIYHMRKQRFIKKSSEITEEDALNDWHYQEVCG